MSNKQSEIWQSYLKTFCEECGIKLTSENINDMEAYNRGAKDKLMNTLCNDCGRVDGIPEPDRMSYEEWEEYCEEHDIQPFDGAL